MIYPTDCKRQIASIGNNHCQGSSSGSSPERFKLIHLAVSKILQICFLHNLDTLIFLFISKLTNKLYPKLFPLVFPN